MSKVSDSRPVVRAGSIEKPATLVRQLGVVSATALVVSNMIGQGIFTTTGFLAGDLGTPGLVLGIWLVGAAVALAGALCYSELGINFPASGGEYVYLTRAYGPTWGFMTGWISFFAGFSAPIAAASLAFAGYLGHFWPRLHPDNPVWTLGSGVFSLRLGGAQAVASGLIALFTVLNFFGVGLVAKIQNVLTATKLLVIGSFMMLGLLLGTGSWEHFAQTATRTSPYPVLGQFAISLFWIYVAYSGWNAPTYVAEEIRRPERTLPISLALGTLLVAAVFLGLNVVFIYACPLEAMKGELAVGALAATRLFGPEVAGTFSLLMAVSKLSLVLVLGSKKAVARIFPFRFGRREPFSILAATSKSLSSSPRLKSRMERMSLPSNMLHPPPHML